MSEDKVDFYVEQDRREPLADKGSLYNIHPSNNKNSAKQLLNAVEIVELNSIGGESCGTGGATTLLNTSLYSSSVSKKQHNATNINSNNNNGLQSSPPKSYDFVEYRSGKKRKLEPYGDENLVCNNEVIESNTSVIYSSNKKRQLQNHSNPHNFLLNSDFFFSENQTTNFTPEKEDNKYTIASFDEKEYAAVVVEDDTLQLTEYQEDIFESLFLLEDDYTPEINPCMVDRQEYINFIKPSMRAILIDWLLQVHISFKLAKETLFQAISLMDRYLAVNKVTLKKLQLLAITCLFTAAKFEEVKLPKLSKYCYMTDNAYTNAQMVEAEMAILKDLEFKVSLPGPLNFLIRFLKSVKNEIMDDLSGGSEKGSIFYSAAESSSIETMDLLTKESSQKSEEKMKDDYDHDMIDLIGQYLLEAAITSPKFIHYKHSYLAAMVLYIVRMMYHESYPQINTFIKQEQTDNENCSFKFDIFDKKIDTIWTDDIVSMTNGVVEDSFLKESVEVLIQELVSPSTKLPTLNSKWDVTVGKCVKNWCKEVYNLCEEQVYMV